MIKFRALALICIFFMDVHVRADEKTASCWGKSLPCPVQAGDSKKVIEAADLRLSLGAQALLEQRDEKTIQLVSGEFYVETAKPVTFKTPYARIWCVDECKALFVRTNDSIEVKSLEGRWLIERNGEAVTYTVAPGLEITLSEVSDDGHAAMEFPQSLPWSPTVRQWGKLYPGTMKQLKPTLVKFREEWKEAVEKVSEMQEGVVRRTIASYEDEQAKEQSRKAAREREDQRLRALFREKNP
jgi:hypothetical protein